MSKPKKAGPPLIPVAVTMTGGWPVTRFFKTQEAAEEYVAWSERHGNIESITILEPFNN